MALDQRRLSATALYQTQVSASHLVVVPSSNIASVEGISESYIPSDQGRVKVAQGCLYELESMDARDSYTMIRAKFPFPERSLLSKGTTGMREAKWSFRMNRGRLK
jgi:hypothetical protein